jgi:nicotinate dehydrogenase large molybdopterin subunit
LIEAGEVITRNLDSYMLAGIADAPLTSRVFALEDLDESDPCGPRGVGEIGVGAMTPAITAAIADAIGWWPTELPIGLEHVLAALAPSESAAESCAFSFVDMI